MGYVVGVDIGGTFTDSSAICVADGRVFAAKARTTPADLTQGLVDSLESLADQAGLPLRELLAATEKFAHGTTQTSNAIFTWRGARTGLVTTRGFRDEILIMRARGRVAGLSLSERRHLRATDKPPKLVPEERIVEVAERVDHRGRVLQPLTQAEARRAVDALLAQGVEAVAVCLLWSPQHPEHELLVERVVRERAPDLHVSLSHRLAPVVGEYERASTAVVNAFVAPTMERYLQRLESRLRDLGLRCPLLILQASGGVVQAEDTVPVHTIESGPAAGLVGVAAQAQAGGYRDVIATDVGGTTFKVGMVAGGDVEVARETVVNQYTLLIPMVDLVSIGAGGGSIAWADERRLRVGPQSAGAEPGPASYGWGGTEPTVTDADVVLGFLSPERFLGGQLRLRADLAHKALLPLAEELFAGDVVRAAAGIRTVVDAQMGDLVRKVTLERGHDPRDFVLFAYGGAGPLHAAAYARAAGARRIVVPTAATVFSAYGAAASDVQTSLMRSVPPGLLEDPAALHAAYGELERAARALIDRQQVALREVRSTRWADMRFARQLHDVRVVGPPAGAGGPGHDAVDASGPGGAASDGYAEGLQRAFLERYERLYGSAAVLEGAPVELLRIGVDAFGEIAKPPPPQAGPDATGSDARTGRRPVFWPEQDAWVDTDVYDGAALEVGSRLEGPALLERPGTTVAVPADATATIDPVGNIVLDLEGSPA